MTPAPWVLLPGMLLDERLWSRLVLPPGTRTPPLSGASLDAVVDDVLDRAPPRFCLGGFSLGGIVAMALVARAPERVERMLLLSTNARPPTPEQRAGWDALEEEVRADRFDRITSDRLWPLLVAPGRQRDVELAALCGDMARAVGPRHLLDQLGVQRSRVDLRPGLACFSGSTTVVTAAHDALCSRPMHEEIVAALPHSRLHVLPGSGHLSPLEAPREVGKFLRLDTGNAS